MGVTETLLVGIACALSQGNSPEAQKINASLSVPQRQLIEYIQKKKVCEELDRYLQENDDIIKSDIQLVNCHSCLMTSADI